MSDRVISISTAHPPGSNQELWGWLSGARTLNEKQVARMVARLRASMKRAERAAAPRSRVEVRLPAGQLVRLLAWGAC